jgi:Ran GTPase-activating protein (RanGAP) involved in mRNA processing and transport
LQEKRKFANDVYNILSFYVHGDKIDQCGALILAFLPEISPPPPLFTQEEFEQISNSCITEAFNVSLPIMSIHTSILHNLDFEINSIKNIYEFFNVIADEKKLPIIKKIKFCNNIEKTEMSIHLLNKFFSRLDEIYFNDVRNLELNSINISPHVCNTLNKNLLCLKNLKILDLGNNHLGSERMMRLIGKIVDIPTLVVLNLENNEIGDLAINKLASNFHCLKKLKTLILNHNNISSVGFKKISQNLSFLNQLTAIDLSYNCAKNEGLMFLSHSFFHLLNLKSLKISHNCSGNKGLTLIIDKIHLLKNLMELDISGNNSGPEPIDMLLKKVRLLTNLTYVDFNGNLVRIETEKEIKDFLEARKDLFKYLKNNK